MIVESDVEDTLSLGLKSREQAKRLESKVFRVALKKSSVEEVTTLHKELQDWLSNKVKPREQVCVTFAPYTAARLMFVREDLIS